MSNCNNQVSQYIEKGFGFKEVKLPCGSTSIHGDTLICDECEKREAARYPQGWKVFPGDTCPHGTIIADESGRDLLCGQCEDGL